jgi:Tfp pilus assembly protein PilN
MSGPSQLSFLPDDYLKRKAQRRANAICAVLFMFIVVGGGLTTMLGRRALKSEEIKLAETNMEYGELSKKLDQVQQMQAKQRTMAQQAELAATLLEKVPRSKVLAELTNNLPAGVSLLDFTMESKKRAAPKPEPVTKIPVIERKTAAKDKKDTAAPEVKPVDVVMKLTGIAETDMQVGQYIRQLNRSKILKDVNLVISDRFEQDKVQVRKFTIEMLLDPDAEIEPTKDNKVAAVQLDNATTH